MIKKRSFGSPLLGAYVLTYKYDVIELMGVCTDICVISNALLVKAFFPNAHIIVNAQCCAGVTEESHETALKAMQACQIEVKNAQ